MRELLIIGCGNDTCGDDAAGILVARELQRLEINACVHARDALDLIELWKTADSIILVDAIVSGDPPGQVSLWDGREAPVEPIHFRYSSHSLGVAEAIEMARLLGSLPKQFLIYGIEACQFEPGTPPSLQVLRAIEKVVALILESTHQSNKFAQNDASRGGKFLHR